MNTISGEYPSFYCQCSKNQADGFVQNLSMHWFSHCWRVISILSQRTEVRNRVIIENAGIFSTSIPKIGVTWSTSFAIIAWRSLRPLFHPLSPTTMKRGFLNSSKAQKKALYPEAKGKSHWLSPIPTLTRTLVPAEPSGLAPLRPPHGKVESRGEYLSHWYLERSPPHVFFLFRAPQGLRSRFS